MNSRGNEEPVRIEAPENQGDAEAAAWDALPRGEEPDPARMTPAQVGALIRNLRIHQVELETQNEELRRAQVDLDAARARYFDLYDRAPVGYLTLDAGGVITESNLTAATLLGVHRAALAGTTLAHWIAPEDRDVLFAYERRRARGTGEAACELRLAATGGATIWARLTEQPAVDEPTTVPPPLWVTISDVSEEHSAQAERRRLAEELEQAHRIELIGRLAGGIAHDFNNMLSVILGTVELAATRLAPADPVQADLAAIDSAARRSADLTAQLLAFARRQVTEPRVVNLNDLVSASLRLVDRLLGEQISVTWRPEPGLWQVLMDPAQVDRVVMNLMVNARDAIRGRGTILVQTRNVTLAGGPGSDLYPAAGGDPFHGPFVQLIVRDDGVGMAPEVLSRIFEPFFSTKPGPASTGLGLATIHGIAAQNGGFVDAVSTPGTGATFTFSLPRHDRAAGAEVARQPSASHATHTGTVLLVEDEEAVRHLVARQLGTLGLTVLSAADGEEAMAIARDHPGSIELVLSDIVLPRVDGRDLIEQVRGVRPAILTALMSGYPADVAGEPFAPIATPLLNKPFSVAELADVVGRVLGTGAA